MLHYVPRLRGNDAKERIKTFYETIEHRTLNIQRPMWKACAPRIAPAFLSFFAEPKAISIFCILYSVSFLDPVFCILNSEFCTLYPEQKGCGLSFAAVPIKNPPAWRRPKPGREQTDVMPGVWRLCVPDFQAQGRPDFSHRRFPVHTSTHLPAASLPFSG